MKMKMNRTKTRTKAANRREETAARAAEENANEARRRGNREVQTAWLAAAEGQRRAGVLWELASKADRQMRRGPNHG